ncbi:Calcium/calmodulin-dependent 3',5'-cyclic nucleotide phosphodiesterase 1B, partial [Perkinsus olseni]
LPDLATLLSPSFDIFDYAASNFINKYDVLPVAAMVIFDDVLRNVDLPERRKRDLRSSLQKFAEAVELGYNNAPFHNPIHATDVALALYMLISEKEPLLDPMLSIICYCAALGHDINHPGYSNWYAILNCDGDEDDTHPLETMHARETIRLLEETGVAEFIEKESLQLIEKMILGTDMQVHNMWVEKAKEYEECSLEDRLTILLHAADLCNPTRTRTAMLKWSALILEEFGHERDLFFAQGKQPPKAIPTRADCPKAYLQIQLGFFRKLVEPLNIRSRWEVLAIYEAEALDSKDLAVAE